MESLKELKWQTWLHDETKCKKDFDVFLKKNSLKKEDETVHLSKSHTNKMEYNLLFVQHLFDIQKFYDWVIVGCYYSIYRAALALLATKGYSSKHHVTTLCALVHLWYATGKQGLTSEDIKLVAQSSLEKEEVSYFAEAKEKRETASYGISEEFSKAEAEELYKNTIVFINKVRRILENR